jgi:hypothetical protein
MNHRPIIDAGPGLNFLSVNKERILIRVLGRLSVPEAVQEEVLRKSRQDERFRAAGRIWPKLTANWIQVLSDDYTPELGAVVRRITQLPMERRLMDSRDLGETMVVAHAVVLAESGETVTVPIDDGKGAELATSEIRRLKRQRDLGRTVGEIILASTLTVLKRAAGTEHIPDKTAVRSLYLQLRGLDDGLPPIEQSGLLSPGLWQNTPR